MSSIKSASSAGPQNLYKDWCDVGTTDVGTQRKLHLLLERKGARDAKQDDIVKAVYSHYEDPDFLAARIKRLGFAKASKVLEEQFPKTKKARSGHVGEILATEAVAALLPEFTVPLKRLRWLDGRESALRGEDIIGVNRQGNRSRFLKGESKSRVAITPSVITEARKALEANNGRPSPHAMAFIMKRLFEIGNDDLAIVFEQYVADNTISAENIVHLLFTFTGNDASPSLQADLSGYAGQIEQHAANLRIADHAAFIKKIYPS
jgi:hypothetical protein